MNIEKAGAFENLVHSVLLVGVERGSVELSGLFQGGDL